MERLVPLEQAAAAVSDANANPPLIFNLPPAKGRQVLENAQNTPVYMHPAAVTSMQVSTGRWGNIGLYLLRPEHARGPLPVIFYIHGAGWVFGSYHTHEKLVRELCARTGCVVVFPEYSRSPEARYPTALEQCYHVLSSLPDLFSRLGWPVTLNSLTVAGDSAGGNLAAALAILAKFRGGPHIHKQLLYYPVTNACFDTGSYREFAECYYLYRAGMIWFWDQYAPSQRERSQITASPLRASAAQLSGLPQAMIITGEADVLRDEGEQYARKLLEAGVPVASLRIQATIHDFVMLNALDQTQACRTAMDASTAWINRKNLELIEAQGAQA